MCLTVFIGVDEPLPLTQHEHSQWSIGIEDVQDRATAVLRLFSKPYVYDVGAALGCGCHFSYDISELEIIADPNAPDEVKSGAQDGYDASRGSIEGLKNCLASVSPSGIAEIYSCWEGDWGEEPETRLEVTADHFGGDSFVFVERQMLIVTL